MPKISFPAKTIPLGILAALILAFGVLIPSLGLYWDDWPVAYIAKTGPLSAYWQFYQYDRPFSAWTYVLLVPLLGVRPIVWQVFTLLLRWLSVLMMWAGLRSLWPKRLQSITWVAFLFAIYPSFMQQQVSIAYSQHWICCLLFFISIWAMIKAEQTGQWYLRLIALGAAGLELWTMEYFVALDLIRPFLLFVLVARETTDQRQRLLLTLRKWLPYLGLLVVYVIWRIFFLQIPGGDPNTPVLLGSLLHTPLDAISRLFQAALQDVVYVVAGIWFQSLQADALSLARPILQAFLVLAVLTAVLSFLYLRNLKVEDEPEETESSWHWPRQAMLIGFVAVLLGILPAWIIGRQVIMGFNGTRFSFAAMFGASLLLVGIMEWFSPQRLAKIALLAVLIGLAVNAQLRLGNQYRDVWEKQKSFYWQLYWRAPSIRPGTALISDGEIFSFMGIYPTSMAINLLYPEAYDSRQVPLWFFSIVRVPATAASLSQGFALHDSIRNYTFDGQSLHSLAINYQPEDLRCLRVLSPRDADDARLPESIHTPIQLSDLGQIQAGAPANWQPPEDIFGPEPDHQWCYYYQKAELADQNQDWAEVNRLGSEAQQKGFSPLDQEEWFPFIEAEAYGGKLDAAYQRTLLVRKYDAHLDKQLCSLWDGIRANQAPSAQLSQIVNNLNDRLGCNFH